MFQPEEDGAYGVSLGAGSARWHLGACGNFITQHSQTEKKKHLTKTFNYHLLSRTSKKGNVGSHTIMSELLFIMKTLRLVGKQREFDWCTVTPYKVSNSCQCRGAWVEYQLDFVDPVTAKRQRQTCCQDGHTWVRLHPTGGCFRSVQAQQQPVYPSWLALLKTCANAF